MREDDPPYDPAPVHNLRKLEAWARRRNPGTMFHLRGVAPSAVAPLIEQFDRLAKIYPEVAARIARITTASLPTAAQSGGSTVWARASTPPDSDAPEIRLNDRAYERGSRIQAARIEQVTRGWHPSGTVAPEAIMTHEFGHHLMFWLHDRNVDVRAETLALGDPSTLSRYAITRFEEAFAEGFTAHYHGDEASSSHPISRGVLSIIRREIERARGEGKLR
ncbi:MAG: hypothetical protein U0893_12265 [Chloroflexota bacterium]